MPAMRVVVVYDDLLTPGGVPYETRALIGGLTANGCRVTALCNRPGPLKARADAEVIADFESEDGSAPPEVRGYGLASIAAVLRREDRRHTAFFLIGSRRPEYLLYATMIRRFGFRAVVFPHGLLAPELLTNGWDGRSKHWLRRQVERAFQLAVDRPVLRRTTMARALSKTEGVRLRALGGRHVFESADGVDRSWLSAPASGAPAQRGILRLLYLGRPQPFQKGIDILLQAIAGLPEPDAVELVLAGPDEARFRRVVVDTLGRFPAWVKLAGKVTGQAKWQAMADAHFLAHVSRFEGMAKCVREAVGHGLPVLASYESNFGDWARSSGAGIATAATVEGVRDAVARATRVTPGEWAAMREAAWRFALDHSWDKVAARILSELDAQAGGPARS